MIEKSIEASESTTYATYYSPNVICNCDSICKFRNKESTLKSFPSPSDSFKKYRNNKQIDLDSIASESSSSGLFSCNSEENILNNLTCYIKLLTLNETIKKQHNEFDSSDWHTCSDTIASSIEPFNKSKFAQKPIAKLESLIDFLDNSDPNSVQKCCDLLARRDPLNKIFNNFQNLNKRLFNNQLQGLVTRWSSTCKKYIYLKLILRVVLYKLNI